MVVLTVLSNLPRKNILLKVCKTEESVVLQLWGFDVDLLFTHCKISQNFRFQREDFFLLIASLSWDATVDFW